MSDPSKKVQRHEDGSRVKSTSYALEICFLAFVFVVVLAAFIEAFNYKLVSSRTPFVIMTPLLILVVWHGVRLMNPDAWREVKFHAGSAISGRYPLFNKLVGLSLAFVALGMIIYAFGHYIGIFAFMLFLMKVMGKEKLLLALIVSAVATGVIFVLFEKGFNIELYRGLLFRYMAGYRVF